MIQILDKTKCCGCTACASICPKHCIEMKPDEEGFFYPVVDLKMCIDCGLCNRICPIENKVTQENTTIGYVVRSRNQDIVKQSTSGGFFTVLAQYALNNGATVYGAGYDSAMQVIHKSARNESELGEMRGSKFVQSNLDGVFPEIREKLNNGENVLFSGTPCQVSGLLSYLGNHPDNLICVDFVCRGVPSPMLWQNYVSTMEKRFKSKIINARFRNKTYGYHSSTMKLTFKNGKEYYGSGRIDPYLKAFVNDMSSRPSCETCAFKQVSHQSDFTMFDCKEFSKLTEFADDDKGYTSVLIHTDIGNRVFDKLKDSLMFYSVSVSMMIDSNGIMACNSAKADVRRGELYKLVQTESIDDAIAKLYPRTRKDVLIEWSKAALYKTGLISLARKLKKIEKIELSKI